MWDKVVSRKHSVSKVFPAKFRAPKAGEPPTEEMEFMLFGDVRYVMRQTSETNVTSWAGHAILRRENRSAAWKFAHYRVWLQN